MRALVRIWRLERKNFKGSLIPGGFGFMLVPAAIPVYAGILFLSPNSHAWLFITAVVGFGTLGLIDDIFGTREAGGFGGHFGLLKKGKVSTGLLKAVLGGIMSLVLGGIIANFRPAETFLNGIVISLSANLLNLLDLRPGRAVSCFWVGLLATVAVKGGSPSLRHDLIPIIVPAVWLTMLDRSAKVMLGDAGSNLLGAVLGLTIVYSSSLPVKLVLVASMIGVHIFAERYSISKLIESNRILRRVDRLLGER